MSNVANDVAATGILGFLRKLYEPIIVWANGQFATKTDVAAIPGANLELASDSDAEDIWDGYTFSTTD